MPLIQDLLSQVLGQAGQTVKTKDPVIDRLLHWLARLQIQIFGPWTQIGRGGITCSVRFRPHDSARIMQCRSPAIAACMVCGQTTCIEHALVAASGEVICRACVEVARQVAPGPSPGVHDQQQRQRQAPPRHPDEEDRAKLRRKYFRRLGLSASATQRDIERAYKKLAAKWHPDRHPDSRKESATKKFRALGEAKDWLLADLESRRAAA